jgi:long-chain acyl-CoA synthetase
LTHCDPILQAFDRLLARDPGAAVAVAGDLLLSRGDLDALARAAARQLPEAPLPPGSLVGLMAANGPAFLASLLALRRAGCAALLVDGTTVEGEAMRAVEALGAAGLLRASCGWPCGPEGWSWIAAGRREPPAPLTSLSADVAVVKLTSGSTGRPRGIVAPAEALLADDEALTATMGLERADRFLCAIPLSHSYGLSSLAIPALIRGKLLVFPTADDVLDPLRAAAACAAEFFPTVPAYLDALVRMAEPPAWPATLRRVITAGAPLSAATSQRFRAVFGRPVHVFYGASECGGIAFDREGGAAERGTVGEPVAGVRVTLDGCPGDAGSGVVVAESPAAARGYLPQEGCDRLGHGRFRTSDLAAWRGGELALLGRIDDLVNVKGKKVNPREVESVLARLSGVDEVAVVGVPHPVSGGELLRAVVACRRGALTRDQIVLWCREHLSGHKVPRSVILVDRLPRTERGKLDRTALLAMTADRGHG